MLPSAPIKEAARQLGFDLVGVCAAGPAESHAAYLDWLSRGFAGGMAYMARHAELRRNPDSLLPGVRSIVAVGLNYYQPTQTRPGYPKIARYALGRDYHKVIRGKLRKLQTTLGSGQHRICVDSAPILEREFAHRAGLGWFGKNTLLIDSRRGSWFLIGLMLTTLEIEPDEPAIGGCGTCGACIEACPTGAIVQVGDHWGVDGTSCISYLTIEKPEEADERIGEWTFGCDICQEVCPFNRPRLAQPLRAQDTLEPDFLKRTALLQIPLGEVSRLDHEEWDGLTTGSPIRRAGLAGLKRNASLNLSRSRACESKATRQDP